jgi:hypothetical protein
MPDVVVALDRRRLPLLNATGGLPSVASPVGPASAELGPNIIVWTTFIRVSTLITCTAALYPRTEL